MSPHTDSHEASGTAIEQEKNLNQSNQEVLSENMSMEAGTGGALRRHPVKSPVLHHTCLLFSLIVGVAWLAPIIYLFVANIRGDIIGAAAWCPIWEGCNVISYWDGGNTTTASQSAKYDIDNHNLLGGLQFIAKALEVWYFYIATSLVWYVTVLLARRDEGIPLGYFMTHMEFGDLLALFDLQLYGTVGPIPKTRAGRFYARSLSLLTHRLFYFVIFVVLMCVVANLMGPSVAVLLIPTLSWNAGQQIPDGQFLSYLASSPPAGDAAIPGCTAAQLQQQSYSCAENTYDTALDALIATMIQEDDQTSNELTRPQFSDLYAPGDTARPIEQSIPFSFNLSTSKDVNQTAQIVWSLSRQTIRGLSSDFQGLYDVVRGDTNNQTILDQYQDYNSSFEILLQRSGPVIGMPFLFSQTNMTTTKLADDKYIKCYSGIFEDPSLAKCMRTGSSWNASTELMQFWLDKNNETEGALPILVTAYWSDKAFYGDYPDKSGCLPDGEVQESNSQCDYNAMFTDDLGSVIEGDQLDDMFVVDYTIPSSNEKNQAIQAQFFPFYGFATYTIDTTEISPSLPAATAPDPPKLSDTEHIVIHPAWFLTAWNVDPNDTVPAFADRGYYMQSVVYDQIVNHQDMGSDDNYEWSWFNFYAMAHAASLIPYELGPVPSNTDDLPNFQPLLQNWVYSETWGWGISSHTAKVGLSVCGVGIIVTIVRTVLAIIMRIRGGSALGILVTAIQHAHSGELHGAEESGRARVRYRIIHENEEELRFQHVSDT